MFILVQRHSGLFLGKAELLKLLQHRRFDWDLVLADDKALSLANWLMKLEPGMLLYLVSAITFFRIGLHNSIQKIDTVM